MEPVWNFLIKTGGLGAARPLLEGVLSKARGNASVRHGAKAVEVSDEAV